MTAFTLNSADATGTFRAEVEKRHTEDANRDIEAAQGEAEHEQETTGKMQGEKGKDASDG